MRILAVIDSFGLGGAESQLARILNYLAVERGHECIACSVAPRLADEVEFDPRVKRMYLNKKRRLDLAFGAIRLASVTRRYRPDVVYSRLPLSNALARLGTWFSGCRPRHVAGIDAVPESYARPYVSTPSAYSVYGWLERRADLVVCNSAATYDAVYRRGYPEGRLRVLHNGIDAEEFRPPNRPPHRNPTRLICVASLRPEKGVIRLVHLLPAILSRHSVELRIVGDGVKRREIEQAIRHLGLQSAVILLGPQRLVAPFLNEADVYVSAAFVEGFGIAVAEAAASGIPAVVFAAPGGLSEVVVDGHTGFVISSSDEAAFVEAVVRLCRDPDLRNRMGLAARQHVIDNFSLPVVAGDLERLFSSQ